MKGIEPSSVPKIYEMHLNCDRPTDSAKSVLHSHVLWPLTRVIKFQIK